ncbi:MAG: arylsulfatase [Bryobacteraceae bacterium]
MSAPLTRRSWLRTAAAASLAGLASAQQDTRPNVVLVMTDDQGYGDLTSHGNPYLRTPNMDGFARQGVEFTRFYVSPVCAPTRASLMTGRYNLRAGVHGVTHGRETMRSGEVTVAECLRSAGYRTALVGKWHLGEHFPYVPHGRGFHEFFGFRTGHWTNYFDTPLERNAQATETRGFITDVLTDEAISFLERNRSNPFFLYVAYNAPHSPYQAPQKYYDRFKNTDLSEETKTVYAMVENLDDNFGRLLESLDRLNLAANTIVIFLTDNGPNGQRFNAGLRGTKGSVYEGGVRVPFFVRWPGRIPENRKVDRIAAHIDLMPTLLDLCRAPRPEGPPLDGRSLRPLLLGSAEAANWPDRMIFTHRDGNQSALYPGAVRTQRFNLVNGRELYEIPNDLGETRNVADKYPEKARELRAAYEAWYDEVARQCGFARLPIPIGYDEENPVVLPATQSYFDGNLKFRHDNGFAHDWIANWTNPGDSVWWELDVVGAGLYRVSLLYLCPEPDLGARLTVSAGAAKLEAAVATATSMEPKPNQNRVPVPRYVDMSWATLPFGELRLPKGRIRLNVRALSKPGSMVMELKEAHLFRVKSL